jgi:succinate dehydrogenase / fumarate reductase cytochrome b subunit
VIGSLPGQVVVFLFTFALYFHFCNGIRHLVWDAGHGLELPTVYASGKAVIATSIVLTLITWAIPALLGGAA